MRKKMKRLIISLIIMLCMCVSCFAGTLYIRTGGGQSALKVYHNCFYVSERQEYSDKYYKSQKHDFQYCKVLEYTFQFIYIEDGKEHKLYVSRATDWWLEED